MKKLTKKFIAIGISVFVSISVRSATSGGHFLLFIIPMGLLSALSQVILSAIGAIVRAITLPAFLIQRRREKKGYTPQEGESGQFEQAEVGHGYFIENDNREYYSIKFLD